MEKRHPYSLIGIDGNALAVIGYVSNAMKQCGYSRDAINMYRTDAMSGDYNNLLSLSIQMIDNCNILSGYDDPMQQMMKGCDDLDYVDSPYSGTQNRIEKLIDENTNYSKIYNKLQDTLTNTLNDLIENNISFTKKDINETLFGNNGILNKEYFWDNLEYNITGELNESCQQYNLKNALYDDLYYALSKMLDEGIEFSKQDINHILLNITTDTDFYNKLSKYIKEDY